MQSETEPRSHSNGKTSNISYNAFFLEYLKNTMKIPDANKSI